MLADATIPHDARNDFYLTLVGGEFSQENIELSAELRQEDGTRVEGKVVCSYLTLQRIALVSVPVKNPSPSIEVWFFIMSVTLFGMKL